MAEICEVCMKTLEHWVDGTLDHDEIILCDRCTKDVEELYNFHDCEKSFEECFNELKRKRATEN